MGRLWGKRCPWRGPDYRMGHRARAERTQNIAFMAVTLEVSKLSGWLNADVSCRVARRAYNAVGEVRAGKA